MCIILHKYFISVVEILTNCKQMTIFRRICSIFKLVSAVLFKKRLKAFVCHIDIKLRNNFKRCVH